MLIETKFIEDDERLKNYIIISNNKTILYRKNVISDIL